MSFSHSPEASRAGGFTLLEMLVAMTVVVLLLGILLNMTNATSRIWRSAAADTGAFREAREAFDAITTQLSQATLQPYWDYQMKNNSPVGYLRQSDLHFLLGPAAQLLDSNAATHPGSAVFFQKSAGEQNGRALKNLLETAGFFVEVGDTKDYMPPAMLPYLIPNGAQKPRMRLVEVAGDPSITTVYKSTRSDSSNSYDKDWINVLDIKTPANRGSKGAKRIAASNVLLFLLRARLPEELDNKGDTLSPDFRYDSRAWETGSGMAGSATELSRNQLPPIVDVILVAIDEASADRLATAGKMSTAALGLDGLFANSKNDQLEGDLQTFQDRLRDLRLNWRLFRASVRITNSRWGET